MQRLLFLDFETYWDTDYTLSRLTPPEYILDDRFELICCSVQEGIGAPYFVDGTNFPAWLRDVDPVGAAVVTHNAMFDAAILSWRYGFVPSTIFCTALLSRAVIGAELPDAKLKTVARKLGLGVKDEEALFVTKGLRGADLRNSSHWDRFVEYNLSDVQMCAGIFFALIDLLPPMERRIMDLVLRCTLQPQLTLDVDILEKHLQALAHEKANLLEAAGTTLTDLMSASKFTRALENLGVTVETKVSPTGRIIPALARTDDFMVRLAEHENPRVQTLAAARLGHKSTIEETRCKRLISIGRLPWQSTRALPVPLVYAGTHTHRLSGTWHLNLQNLPRGSVLRSAISAPPGKKIVVADFAQIEARIVATLANQTDLVTAFALGQDVYAQFARLVFGYDIDKKTHPSERFIGKTAVLGLGYGCGAAKFYDMVVKSAHRFGITLTTIEWSLEAAEKVKTKYRQTYSNIPALWYTLDGIICNILRSDKTVVQHLGPVLFMPGKVRLPNGLYLHYRELSLNDEGAYVYTYGREKRRIYGAALLENIVQFLARNIAMSAAIRLYRRGYRMAMQVHDELVFVIDENDEQAVETIRQEMTKAPTWLPTLPLAVDISEPVTRYGDAK